MTYRLAVVDDHMLVREGMVDILSSEADFIVEAEGASSDDAIAIATSLHPDLICLDVNMPGGGVEAAARVRAAAPGVRIVMFSFRQDLDIVQACLAAGADGYVVKGVSGPELIGVLRKILGGQRHIDPKLAAALAAAPLARSLTLGELVGAEA
jgi:two-component system, NarL family, nitrate/nitrite response regulator NarL